MKSIVIHVSDSVCRANNRDPEAKALIEAGKTFGTVESLDATLAAERAACEAEIARLKAQYETEVKTLKEELAAIAEHKITAEELEVLRAVRKKSATENAHYEAELQRRDTQLKKVADECEARRQQIRALYNL